MSLLMRAPRWFHTCSRRLKLDQFLQIVPIAIDHHRHSTDTGQCAIGTGGQFGGGGNMRPQHAQICAPYFNERQSVILLVLVGICTVGPRCRKNRPHPLKTRRYHASPHHPTLASISNSYAVCRRLPPHHQLKIPTNSPVGIFLPAAACSQGLAWVPADFAEDPGGGIRPRFLSPLARSLRSGAR